MKINKIEKWLTIFFISASIFVSVLLAEAVILTLTNQFKVVFIYLALIPAFAISMLFPTNLKREVKFLPKITLPVFILILLVSLILIFYPHDTFGGADQAIYSSLASHLASSSSLKIPSYLNSLPGNYVEGIRTYYQGYPIWLGIQAILFGVQWMLRSNVILIILGLSSFFLVSSYLGGSKIGLIATILFSSSMPFLWFSRETMSENLSFFLLWSLILFLIFFLKTKNHTYLIPVFICSWLFGLTRFEGFLLQFVLLLVLFPLLFLNKISLKKILVIITIYILVLISNIYITKDIFLPIFFKVYVPSVSFSIKRDISSLIPKNLLNNNINYSIKDTSSQPKFNNLSLFIFLMMAKYNFILPIFSILLITVTFFIQLKRLDMTKKFFFIILILLIPEYYKLISPNVSLPQPWLYRRYIYALLPLGYLCLTILLSKLKNKKLLIILLSSLFIINIILSSPILFLKNDWMLVDKIEKITKDISQKDLVLIDSRSPLNYYDVRNFLIIQKGIRSLLDWQATNSSGFVPEHKVFNGIPYEKIFYLSTSINIKKNFPLLKIVNINELEVNYTQLVPYCQLYLLGKEEGLVNPYNIETLPFSSVKKYCSKTGNDIINNKEQLYLYELIFNNH